jgi:hypothetical protein
MAAPAATAAVAAQAQNASTKPSAAATTGPASMLAPVLRVVLREQPGDDVLHGAAVALPGGWLASGSRPFCFAHSRENYLC